MNELKHQACDGLEDPKVLTFETFVIGFVSVSLGPPVSVSGESMIEGAGLLWEGDCQNEKGGIVTHLIEKRRVGCKKSTSGVRPRGSFSTNGRSQCEWGVGLVRPLLHHSSSKKSSRCQHYTAPASPAL